MTEIPIELNYSTVTLLISIVALIISTIALFYTIVTFLLKYGNKIRCDISTMSTIETDEKYISSMTLENLKDKATVIFEIYLRIGYNNYLLIEDHSDSPLILKPFEVYYKQYDPILFYAISMDKMIVSNHIYNRKRKIILSTTNGRYIVRTNTKRWSVNQLFFKNYSTAVINPFRLNYNGINYGSNTLFLLIFKKHGEEDIIKPILKNNHKHKIFTKFDLTIESIDSKENLTKFIQEQINNGNLMYDSFEVIDFGKRVNEIKDEFPQDIQIEPLNFFQYFIIGKFYTYKENLKMKKINKRK